MKVHHIGVWVNDLELMKAFYVKYLGAVPSFDNYTNPIKHFESNFLQMGETAIELMRKTDQVILAASPEVHTGYAHST